jgi:hypothetical protein
MTLELKLPPHVESALRERAAAAGVDVASFVRLTLEEKLAAGASEGASAERSLEQWMAAFDAWVTRQRPVVGPVDDSRDSIYQGRGE